MELLVIRHAKAEDHGHPQGDRARALVPKGEVQSERIGRFLHRLDCLPDVTLTSPLVRARQTAERMCAAAGLPAPVVQPWLASGMAPDAAVAELAAFGEFDRVAVVGHEPDLSGLVAALLGTTADAIEVKKASVTRLLLDPRGRRARLLFHAPPALHGRG